jgi:hypothetical protein
MQGNSATISHDQAQAKRLPLPSVPPVLGGFVVSSKSSTLAKSCWSSRSSARCAGRSLRIHLVDLALGLVLGLGLDFFASSMLAGSDFLRRAGLAALPLLEARCLPCLVVWRAVTRGSDNTAREPAPALARRTRFARGSLARASAEGTSAEGDTTATPTLLRSSASEQLKLTLCVRLMMLVLAGLLSGVVRLLVGNDVRRGLTRGGCDDRDFDRCLVVDGFAFVTASLAPPDFRLAGRVRVVSALGLDDLCAACVVREVAASVWATTTARRRDRLVGCTATTTLVGESPVSATPASCSRLERCTTTRIGLPPGGDNAAASGDQATTARCNSLAG